MVGIKNFEMPSNCYICDLHNYHECDFTGESIEEDYCWNGNSREKHCPLREVEAISKDQYETRLKAEKMAMLDEIRVEVEMEKLEDSSNFCVKAHNIAVDEVLQIIDKYKAEEVMVEDRNE